MKIINVVIFLLHLNCIKNVQSQTCTIRNARNGICVPLSQCPTLIAELFNQMFPVPYAFGIEANAASLLCGFNGNHYMVCCPVINVLSSTRNPKNSIYGTTTAFAFAPLSGITSAPLDPHYQSVPPTTTTVIFQPTFAITPPYQPKPTLAPVKQISTASTSVLSPSCGIRKQITNRVVGGQPAPRGSYPWIAALGYRGDVVPSTLEFKCAGSLISDRMVVTSAHCITDTLTLVRLGANDLTKITEKGASNYFVQNTFVHEAFDIKSLQNDIALIELTAIPPNTEFIDRICLPESNYFLTENFLGMNPFVAGWGAEIHKGSPSNLLRHVQVPIVSLKSCEQNYESIFKFVKFSDKMICAGNSNVDACQGDSGGPLMMPQLSANGYTFFLLGIVSFGYECSRPGYPGVYTRVASYIPWIKSHIK